MAQTRTRRDNVPAETSSLVGRREELAEIAVLVGRSPLVTLTGGAGVGKTRLAVRTADRLRGSFADGVWVVELSAQQNGDLIGHDIAAALGLREQSARPQPEVLADFVADKRLLLVLDTCDHLTDACAALLRRMLPEAPHARVLATSRRPLGLPGERVLPIEPLAAPGDAGADAVRLFTERAHALVPGLTLDPAAVARVCRRLDGIPLAIELAARRLRTLSLQQIAERLDDRFELLVGGSPAPLRRHQTLRTAVGWSHELCTAQERLLWARLSVFAGPFDADAARAVCADERLPVLPLPGLVDRSVLTAEGSRYRMLDTVRDYGGEWLRRLGEEDALTRRHRDHYLAQARRAEAEWSGPHQLRWADWARRELPNLTAALDHDDGSDLVTALWFVWCCLGQARRGRHYLERALRRHTRPDPARAKALWVCAWAALGDGDTAEARARAAEAYETAIAAGDPAAAGRARQVAAAAALACGDLDGAGRLAAEAAELSGRAGPDHAGLAAAEVTLAMVSVVRGEPDRAVEVLARQAERCAGRGELWARAQGDHVRSLAELDRGEPGAAEAHARAALEVKWRLGDAVGGALAMDQLAAAAAAGGDGRRAACLLGAARRMRAAAEPSRPGPPEPAAPRTPGKGPGAPRTRGEDPVGSDGPGPAAAHAAAVHALVSREGAAASRERTERRARALVGDAVYDRLFARGLVMDPGVAVARIRDAGGDRADGRTAAHGELR
ncbi:MULTISPECIES: ATP-binding protein [Streptosporangium]|uniref:ATPase n=1 Tax=Streptosporangium brasiliense TaxID=47480 RepID=A0ABT9R1H3_9ACTN|nr:AAA family ATPase [Streptosporangium brasiliense]MDP9863085.1 putative ATPase [Streptosporangium brasiliense]